MKYSLTIFIISSLYHFVYSQEISKFSISTGGNEFGELQFVKYVASDSSKEHYLLESKSSIWMLYKVHYRLEAFYCNNVLDSSKAFYKINGLTKHLCHIVRSDSLLFIKEKGSKLRTIKLPKHHSYCRSLFNPEQIQDSLFSEYDGSFKKINHHTDSSFSIINSKNKAEAKYYYSGEEIIRGEVFHFLLNFQLTKSNELK